MATCQFAVVCSAKPSLEVRWKFAGGSLEVRWRFAGGSLEVRWRFAGGSLEACRRGNSGICAIFSSGYVIWEENQILAKKTCFGALF